jgi:hypothetical protein
VAVSSASLAKALSDFLADLTAPHTAAVWRCLALYAVSLQR